MTVAEMEQRLIALEGTVAQLVEHASRQTNPEASQEETAAEEEALLPGVEYPLTVEAPAHEEFQMRGKIVAIEEGYQGLSLSDAEWASLQLENEDDR